MDFKKRTDIYRAHIESYLQQWYERFHKEPQSKLYDAMEYSLLAGGKRLRPIFALDFCRMAGGDWRDATPFAAAIEMIHTYSLIHDDLPCMDNDDYRRGRLTNHKVYGEAMAVLAGDALLNFAFETASKAFEMCPEKSLLIGKAFGVLAKKAGIYGMIGGQVVDVNSEGQKISKEVLDFIYALKTSALIECSMMVGAILAGASDEQIEAVEKIAKNVGIAFQIQDDILDVTSTVEVLGKPILSDEKNEKTTYVTLFGLEEAKGYVESISREAIAILESFKMKDTFLKELLESLIHRIK